MTDLANDPAVHETANLLNRYACDLNGYTVEALVDYWLRRYPASWLRLAVIEALYQGRYKAISVDQILTLWHRRGQPVLHFNHEFERIICSQSKSFSPGLELLPDSQPPKPESAEPTVVTPVHPAPPLSLPSPDISNGTYPGISEATDSLPNSPELYAGKTDLAQSTPSVLPIQVSIPPSPTPSNGEARSTSKPISFPEVVPLGEEGWSREQVVKQPILQFIPLPEDSEFYTKLKAVSQEPENVNPEPGIV